MGKILVIGSAVADVIIRQKIIFPLRERMCMYSPRRCVRAAVPSTSTI